MAGYKKIMILLCIVSFLMIPFGSSALAKNLEYPIENSAEVMAADLLVVRPLQFIGLVTGAVCYAVSLPFSFLGKNHEDAYERMVAEPAKITFVRPLGVF